MKESIFEIHFEDGAQIFSVEIEIKYTDIGRARVVGHISFSEYLQPIPKGPCSA
jgi:hypothetical protein